LAGGEPGKEAQEGSGIEGGQQELRRINYGKDHAKMLVKHKTRWAKAGSKRAISLACYKVFEMINILDPALRLNLPEDNFNYIRAN
jgi:hypothetical protein